MKEKEIYIVHVDMDAFFASVEQRDDPSLKNRPVIVGADPKGGKGRGVVAACSYEARKYGIHSAMPISRAYRSCPDAAFLKPDMNRYYEASHRVLDVFERFTPDIEPLSIDEAFLDITNSFHLFGTPLETCIKIKRDVNDNTGLTASVGMAPNKMTAKIASDLEKPDGLVEVSPADILGFLHPLPVEKMWGIGEKTAKALKVRGINTIGDISDNGRHRLMDMFGKNGLHLWELSCGKDPRKIETEASVSSVSNEYTFETDESDTSSLLNTLMGLSEKVAMRLRRSGLKGRTVTLKIRFSDFSTFTRSHTIDRVTDFVDVIYGIASEKMRSFDTVTRGVRLLGIKVSSLADTSSDRGLFDDHTDKELKKERLHRTLDFITEKYGERALRHRC